MTKQYRILMLGYRKGLVDACNKLGIHSTILIDPWENISELPTCGDNEKRIFVENLSKDETTLFSLMRSNETNFDAVITTEEYFVVNASILSCIVSKPYIEPYVAVAFRDKFYQKKLLRGVVPVTDSWMIDDIENFVIVEKYPYPVVLKPVAGAATSYTYIAANKEELKKCIELHKQKLVKNPAEIPRSMVIERFVYGDEWHIDGWVLEGKLQSFTASKYSFPLIGIRNGGIVGSVTLHPETNKKLYDKFHQFVEKALQKLGLKNSVFHMELFKNDENDELIFSECAARVGGGFIYKAFQYLYDINLYEVLVRLSLGEKVLSTTTKTSQCVGWTFLPSVSSTIKSLPDSSLLMNMPGVIEVEYSWNPEQEMPDTKLDTTQRTGQVLITGKDEDEVLRRTKDVLNYFTDLTKN